MEINVVSDWIPRMGCLSPKIKRSQANKTPKDHGVIAEEKRVSMMRKDKHKEKNTSERLNLNMISMNR